jgi:hypothetical protein
MLIFIGMNIKKIIREEIEGLEWIENIKPTLLNKIIIFEPLIDDEEFDKVIEMIQLYDNNVDIENVKREYAFIHHLVIDSNGFVAYGGIDDEEDLNSETIDRFHENVDWYVNTTRSSLFQNPEKINGREFFDL